MQGPAPKLKLESLVKTRSKDFQLGPIDFELNSATNVVIFGRNGSGKSTLFELMTANLDPDSGMIFIDGQKCAPQKHEVRKKIGYLPQEFSLPPWVFPIELLEYAASLHAYSDPKKIAKKWLEFWGCDRYQKTALTQCSYGMQKRVALALAEIHSPDILVLDEPVNGLDIEYVSCLEERLSERKKEGKVSILSVHSAHFAAKNCDLAFFLEAGSFRSIEKWKSMDLLERIHFLESHFAKKPGATQT